ncbi:Sua5/YciO/YrdC/YwlC family protein [Kitasatospora sp. NPDC093806]|uniref:Sua5/YciO/YrdC/YwlC family protein n=1 Tax=Kitasatospora sp. NPDC093806 TaxID=3155075 RepID=UPI0034135988
MNPTPQAGRASEAVDVDGARRALRRGTAVVLPNPAPLTHVVAGPDPQAVNTAKGRPADQAVALWAHDPDTFAAAGEALDLTERLAALARRLLVEERVTLLLPLRSGAPRPDWLAPATRDGWTMLFGARWTPLLPVLADHPVLYVSSANRTGHPPAATVDDALAMFPPAVPVLALPAATTDSTDSTDTALPPRAATTTLRLHPDGRLDLHRHGAQDRPYPDADRYLEHVHATYRAQDPASEATPTGGRS